MASRLQVCKNTGFDFQDCVWNRWVTPTHLTRMGMAPSMEIFCLPVGWRETVARAPIAEAASALSLFSAKISSSSFTIGLFAMS